MAGVATARGDEDCAVPDAGATLGAGGAGWGEVKDDCSEAE